ncbi:MAG: peptidylprolyl isomerase [Ethanoligenens sp.]
MSKNPIVTITMENGGQIKIELLAEHAPNTVNNFISLVNNKFYDGLIFHRVISGFMIQGGCPDGTGMGGAGYNICGEFAANGIDNKLKHNRGVISMARAASPNSASSQFFIVHQDAPHLDRQYAAFGKVIEGMDEVDKIANTDVDFRDKPVQEQKIASMTVELFEHKFEEPQKCNKA